MVRLMQKDTNAEKIAQTDYDKYPSLPREEEENEQHIR
jgi:hypothetical protein